MSARLETDPDIRAMFAADASGLRYLPDGVARPESVEEVSEILRSAADTRTPVTPAGMQTSTTGASITEDGILLSLRALSPIIDIDRQARIVRVSAGAILGDVKRAAAAEGLLFAPGSDERGREHASVARSRATPPARERSSTVRRASTFGR